MSENIKQNGFTFIEISVVFAVIAISFVSFTFSMGYIDSKNKETEYQRLSGFIENVFELSELHGKAFALVPTKKTIGVYWVQDDSWAEYKKVTKYPLNDRFEYSFVFDKKEVEKFMLPSDGWVLIPYIYNDSIEFSLNKKGSI